MAQEIKTIDIDHILKSKMGNKAKFIPKLLTKWLKHIIHQDDVNSFLHISQNLTGVEWLEKCLEYLNIKLEVEGIENLPPITANKTYTFVANHPLGGIDGVAIGAIIGKHYNENFRYLVNDLLMNLPGLAPLCIPINKTGKQNKNFPTLIKAGFSSNRHIVMFPAGLCSRQINGEIHDIPWNKTFVSKSIEYKRDIVPIHFQGQNSKFFYNLAKICKTLGLKFNIAMIFLVDEMYKNRNKCFRVTIGKPIKWQTLDNKKTPKQWAIEIENMVYNLPK